MSASEEILEKINGQVERITFHNSETGFCVLRVKVQGRKELAAVIGKAVAISVGEAIEGRGVWMTDKKHGLQFKAEYLTRSTPTTIDGIEKYLASGMLKGIGPHYAKKLINAFGESVFEVIEQTPEKLISIEGLGEKRKEIIVTSWTEQQSARQIMIFLQSHGINTSKAMRIHKVYGDKAIEKIQENPYRLAEDIYGIGFKTADEFAKKLGTPHDSIMRALAGVQYTLQSLCQHGHCAAYYTQLINTTVELLSISEEIVKEAIAKEIEVRHFILENINEEWCIFPVRLYQAEKSVAKNLKRLNEITYPWGKINLPPAISNFEKNAQMQLSPSQKIAIESVLQNKLSIITGGPGVGKTTILNCILKILHAQGCAINLCAPTGRAAKRLMETTGKTAKTIHRLLEFDPHARAFKHAEDNPLPIDVLIVDESSMIDLLLMHQLLKAIPDHAALIFVGDVDQLPSVGCGAVLLDLIKSGVINTVKLTEIHRQEENSNIIVNAHRINQGLLPLPNPATLSDFYTIYVNDANEIHDQLLSLIQDRLPSFLNCNPITDIQLLTPMNKGGLGTHALNVALQKELNGLSEPKITRFGLTFAPGDKVIQTVNNYEKDVFNGDIGFISQISLDDSKVKISFENKTIEYEFNELEEINLAYAITIHKSQGSEFPIVVIPLSMQHHPLLIRNLLYTAVTRARKLLVLVAQKKAVYVAVNNNEENKRLTQLAERLRKIYSTTC